MQAITTIGLDIAKSVFQVHGVDAGGPSQLGGDELLVEELGCELLPLRAGQR